MSKKNFLNLVNTTPANTANNVKESKMNIENQNEMNDAIEGILINSLFGLSFPLICTYTSRLAMAPGSTAFLLAIVASLTAVTAGCMAADLRTRKARFVVEAHHVVTSVLTGTALFRCLVEGLSEGLPVDYQSLPAAIIVCGAMMLQFAAAKAFAASINK